MMEVVLTRLRDFSCKTTTFQNCMSAGQSARCRVRDPRTQGGCSRDGVPADGHAAAAVVGSPCKLDIGSALAWLREELMEMRSQDQALIRQLMDLHTGIQELKQELSDEEEESEEDSEEEEPVDEDDGSYWDSASERGSGSVYSSSGEAGSSISCVRMTPPSASGSWPKRMFNRRSSVP